MAIRDVPLKRKNLKNPQIQSYTEAIRSGQKTYHVVPDDRGWQVKRIGERRGRRFATQQEAIGHAVKQVQSCRGEVVIHNQNGLIRERRAYPDVIPPSS